MLALGVSVTTVGCAPARDASPPTSGLRFRGVPDGADARVTIDDVALGAYDNVARRGVRVRRGPHRVSVEAEGYFPYDTTVQADKDIVFVDVALKKLPD
jgi:hypothetical protein